MSYFSDISPLFSNSKCIRKFPFIHVVAVLNFQAAPSFATNPYATSFNENESPGYAVQTVVATDSDVGSNGAITYSISAGNTGSVFSIGSVSGTVS